MDLFLTIAKVHKQPEVETLLNAPNQENAENRIAHAVQTGTLVMRSETHDHAGNPVLIVNTIDGILERCEAHSIYRYPNTRTNFFGRATPRAPRYNPRKNALNRIRDLRNETHLTIAQAIAHGWNEATKTFSSRAKSPDAKLKTALKSYKGNNPEDFKRGFLKQWQRLNTHLANKPKKTKKKAKPEAIPA